MKLTRIFLNPRSRRVAHVLRDSHALHSLVLALFEPITSNAQGGARQQLGVLHRIELPEAGARVVLFVQSREAPDPARWDTDLLDPRAGGDAIATTSLDPLLGRIEQGMELRFRVRGNPTRKIDTKSGPDGRRRNGRRVPVRGDEARLRWLAAKLARAGMTLVGATMTSDATQIGRPAGSPARTHEAWLFDGVLRIEDPTLARGAVEAGLGPAKAYGFGLLSLAPVG